VEIEETITINHDFHKTRIIPALDAKFDAGVDITKGAMLFQAQNIFLDPAMIFGWVWRIPGSYEFILVANRFDSRGVKIDLSGVDGPSWTNFPAAQGTPGEDGIFGDNTDGQRGGPGEQGKNGGDGSNGHSIKGFFTELVNIEINCKGGNGGDGGPGGDGGRGGDGHGMRAGSGGDGGPGGNGGRGGNAGQIKLMFSNNPSDVINRLHTSGGTGGSGGQGGSPGPAGSGAAPTQPGGHPGARGSDGASGLGSTATVQSNVSFDDLWTAVSDELQCS
jgi:hypothetical protein